ncbi:unnamed protein product [Closterium sp. NIES-54]
MCPLPRAKGARGPISWLHNALCSPHHAALLRAPVALFFLLLVAVWISGAFHWPLFSLPALSAVESGVGPSELAVEMARLQAIERLTSRLSIGSTKPRDDEAAGDDVKRKAPRKVAGGNAHPTVSWDERGSVNKEPSGKEVAHDTDLPVEQETSAGNAGGSRKRDGVEVGRREDAREGIDASDALNGSTIGDGGSGKGTGREERTSEPEFKTEEARRGGEKRGEEDEGRRGGGGDSDSEEATGGVDGDQLDPATPTTHADGAAATGAALSGNEGDFTAAAHDPPTTAAAERDAATNVSDHSTSSPPSDENASSASPNGNDDVSQASPSVAQPSCDGRRVFVYSMPPVFNDDIVRTACDDDPLLAWLTCDAFRNRAQGPRLPANRDGGRALIAALLAAKMETAQARVEREVEDTEGAEAGEWAWLHRWYSTEQHQIEAHFRTRLENHPCRTHDDTEADVFLVPAYMGWNAYKNTLHSGHFPHPGLALKEFLLGQPAFQRTKGARHVVVLGRAIWDFANYKQVDDPPHYNVVFVPELANVTFLTVEQPPYRESYAMPIFSVPYTTTFHPASLAEINHWLELVAARRRPFLFSYVGGRRPSGTTSGPLRKALIAECERAGNATCLWMKCTGPDEVGQELPLFTAADAVADAGTALGAAVEAVVGSAAPRDAEGEDVTEWVPSGCYDTWQVAVVMLQSRFCLQPTGDSSVRRSTFDSLLAGCIPVFFKEDSFNMQYPWHFPEDRSSISVTLDEAHVLNGTVDVAAELAAIPEERVASMQARIRELVPQLLYRHVAVPRGGERGEGRVGGNAEGGAVEIGDGEWKDAFDVSFDSLVAEFKRREGKSEGG